jgi:hypothetical protein
MQGRCGSSLGAVPASIYLGQIICPADVVTKINSKHGVTEQDVRDVAQWPAIPMKTFWIGLDDDRRGPRVVVIGQSGDGRLIQVVLYPVGDPAEGTWRLGTAVVQT